MTNPSIVKAQEWNNLNVEAGWGVYNPQEIDGYGSSPNVRVAYETNWWDLQVFFRYAHVSIDKTSGSITSLNGNAKSYRFNVYTFGTSKTFDFRNSSVSIDVGFERSKVNAFGVAVEKVENVSREEITTTYREVDRTDYGVLIGGRYLYKATNLLSVGGKITTTFYSLEESVDPDFLGFYLGPAISISL